MITHRILRLRQLSCGAGPYDLSYFNSYVLGLAEYPMPVFLGYISNAYSEYDLFANPLTDLYNGPYAGRIPGLYDGMHSSDQINGQLTVSIADLFRADYISGYVEPRRHTWASVMHCRPTVFRVEQQCADTFCAWYG